MFMPYVKYLRKDKNGKLYITSLRDEKHSYDQVMILNSRTYGTKEELLASVASLGKIVKIIDETI